MDIEKVAPVVKKSLAPQAQQDLKYEHPGTKQKPLANILQATLGPGVILPNRSQKKISDEFSKYISKVIRNLGSYNCWMEYSPGQGEFASEKIVNPNHWIPISPKYKEIQDIVTRCFDSKLNTYLLLTGARGRGRSSAVYYAVKQLREMKCEPDRMQQEPLLFVEIDAAMSEMDKSTLMNYLVNKLLEARGDPMSMDSNLYESGNYHEKLIRLLKDFRVIIYIKNVHVFAEQTRQVFLYSFLDNINQFAMKVVLIFSTSHVFFLSKLEKRVRSRFSFHEICFEEVDMDTMVRPVLEDKLTIQNFKNLRIIEVLVDRIKRVICNDPQICKVFERSILLGQGLDAIISVVHTAFMISPPQKLLHAVEGSDQTASQFLVSKVLEARKLINFEGGDVEILNSLPKPVKLCVLVLSEVLGQKKSHGHDSQSMYTTYQAFKWKHWEIVKHYFRDTINLHWWLSISQPLLKDGLINLSKMGYVYLSKTPIDNETNMRLSDMISPLFVKPSVKDNDIRFEMA